MKKIKKACAATLTFILALTMALSYQLNVSAVSTKKKVDLVFVVDSTGSMNSYINSVKENLTSFVNEIESKKLDLSMAVVEYRDIEVDGASSTKIHEFSNGKWTSDSETVIKALNNIEVDGGGDDPETPTDAFQKLLNDWDDTDAEKFVFLLTDADYKELGDTDSDGDGIPDYYNMELCTQVMREKNIKTSVISKVDFETRYHYLYTMTGGIFIDIDSEDYYKLMQDFSNYIYETITDSDGDGIPDEWEINGVDYNNDGVIDVDLKAMGADPNVPDIFIEVDYMYKSPDKFLFWDVNEKKCTLSSDAYRRVYNAFKSQGINIHIDAGADSIMNFETNETWGDRSRSNSIDYEDVFQLGSNYENWNQLAMDNFDKSRWTTFRYCSLVNKYQYPGGSKYSSGIAEQIPGQFFIVATSCIDDGVTGQAGTFMHELGHTLGLSHGGIYMSSTTGQVTNDHQRYKPNHISIMNYTYQFPGIKTVLGDNIVNFQNFDLPEINENLINESNGVDPSDVTKGMGLYIRYNNKDIESWDSVDFNKNGKIDSETVSFDINPSEDEIKLPVLTETLNEWKNLKYDGNLIGGHGEDFNLEDISTLIAFHEDMDYKEISVEEALKNNVYGNKYECKVNSDNVNSLYARTTNQTLRIPVENLYNASTRVKLNVKSDIFDTDVSLETDIAASEETVTQKICEAKVKDNLNAGIYDIEYVLTLESGEIITQKGKVEVKETEIKKVKVGYSESLPNTENIEWISSDANIIQIDSGKYIAKSTGKAYIYGNSSDENYAFIIEVTANSQETTTSTSEPTSMSSTKETTPNTTTTTKPNSLQTVSTNNNTGVVQTGNSNIAILALIAMMLCIFVLYGVYYLKNKR